MDIHQTIADAANEYGLDPNLFLRQAYQESGLNQGSRSSAGAIGVMQLMPGTAKELGVNPYDATENIRGGAKYMRQMLDRFGGNYQHALAAYNAGPGRVDDYINNGTPLPAETQNYVPAIMKGGALSASFNNQSGAPMADPGALYAQPQPGRGMLDYGLPGAAAAIQDAGAYLMGISNPGALAATHHYAEFQKASQPHLVEAGVDPISGKKSFVLFNPMTGQVGPAPTSAAKAMAAAQGASNGTGGFQGLPDSDQFYGALDKFRNGQMPKEDLMKLAGPIGDYAQSLVEGKADPRFLGPRSQAIRTPAIGLAHALDENFNENQIPARQKYYKDLLSNNPGSIGGAIASAGKITQHLEHYLDNSEELAKQQMVGGAYNPLNTLQIALKKAGADTNFKSILNAMNTDRDFVASEIVKLSSGGHGALADREQVNALLDPNKSPEERRAAARQIVAIMQGGIDPLVHNYNEAFGLTGTPKERATETFFSGQTNKSIENILRTTAAQQPSASRGEVRYMNGKAYVRGPNGEAVPYQ